MLGDKPGKMEKIDGTTMQYKQNMSREVKDGDIFIVKQLPEFDEMYVGHDMMEV